MLCAHTLLVFQAINFPLQSSLHGVECVSNGRSRLRQWTLIITTGQDYNKARGSHVTKRGYTEVLAKPTKYSISPITSNNHCMALMQGFFSLCHTWY